MFLRHTMQFYSLEILICEECLIYVKNTLAKCNEDTYLTILQLSRVDSCCKLPAKLHHVTMSLLFTTLNSNKTELSLNFFLPLILLHLLLSGYSLKFVNTFFTVTLLKNYLVVPKKLIN